MYEIRGLTGDTSGTVGTIWFVRKPEIDDFELPGQSGYGHAERSGDPRDVPDINDGGVLLAALHVATPHARFACELRNRRVLFLTGPSDIASDAEGKALVSRSVAVLMRDPSGPAGRHGTVEALNRSCPQSLFDDVVWAACS